MIPPATLNAFRRTRYVAGGVEFRIGRRVATLDGLLVALGAWQAIMITAWNPGGRRLPPAVNARRGARLALALRGHAMVRAESGAGRWRETQWLVVGPEAWMKRLGRQYRQLALVRLRRGSAPCLLMLR